MARYGSVTVDGSGGVQELIPDIILPEVIETAASVEVFRPLVRDFDLTGEGGSFPIPQAGALAWGTLETPDADGPDETAFNTASRTLTPVLHYVDVVIPIDVYRNVARGLDLEEEVKKEAGVGLAQYRDALFAALYTEAPASTPDHEIGVEDTEISFSDQRDAYELLAIQEAPMPYVHVVYPTQMAELLKDDTFMNASVKGSPVLTGGIGPNGFLTEIIGMGVYVSKQIDDVSGHHSMVFSKNAAFAYGFKKLAKPGEAVENELMLDILWDGKRRTVEVNMTIHADAEGAKGTSTTTNTWLVDLKS